MNQIQEMFHQILAGVPNIIRALLLALLAWLVASIVRGIIIKGGKMLHMPSGLKKIHVVKEEEKGYQLLKSLGSLGFFITVLIMAPAVLEALNINSVSQPLMNMVDGFVSFIPNIVAAGIILFIGYLLAKIARDIVTNLAETFGSDNLSQKIEGLDEEDDYKISKIIGSVVFALIIIPVVVAGLDVLGITAISVPAANMLDSILYMIPNVIVAAILILIGIAIARFASKLLKGILANSGIDRLACSLFKHEEQACAHVRASTIIAQVVNALIILFFLIEALDVIQLQVLTRIGATIIAYLPNVIGAGIILVIAYIAARFLGNMIEKYTKSVFLSASGKVLIYIFAIFMTFSQLNLATEIVNIAFYFIIGAISLAFVLAFGLGGRDFAKKQLEKFDRKIDEEGK